MSQLIRFGGYQPERSVHTRAVRVLEHELAARPGGRISFEFTPAIMAKGHAAADLLTLTEAGDLDMCYFASSYLAKRVPELSILDLPFQGSDRASIWRRLDGEAGARLKAAVATRTGFEVLAFWDNGIRHISNGVRAIRTPADCRGLSIRTLDNQFHQAIFAALGFIPRFIDVKDLAESVRTRVVDAQENPLTNIINFEIEKTHRFVTLLAQFFGVALVLGNGAAMRGMAAGERAAIEAAVCVATESQRAFAAEEDAGCLAALCAEGAGIVEAGDIDQAAFKAAVADVVTRETAAIDPALLAAWTA
jgi:TRAP-type transport system periplasmic protein